MTSHSGCFTLEDRFRQPWRCRRARGLHRRGIACGGCLARGGKELPLEAIDSGVALFQGCDLSLELPRLLLDVVDGTPVQHRQQAPPGRQGAEPFRPGHARGGNGRPGCRQCCNWLSVRSGSAACRQGDSNSLVHRCAEALAEDAKHPQGDCCMEMAETLPI